MDVDPLVLNRTTLQNRCRNAVVGIKKDLSNVVKITLEAVDYTPTTLMALFQSYIDLADAAVTARASWLIAVQKEQAARATIVAALASLRAYVTLNFGSGAVDTQADFGFSPKKVVVKTAETKANAAIKANATKKARQTTVSPETVTPATTPTNPAPAVTPQAPAPTKS
jgi:hypothetical protein